MGTIVQAKSTTFSGNSGSITGASLTSPVTAGNTLIAVAGSETGTVTFTSAMLTDASGSNTWALVTNGEVHNTTNAAAEGVWVASNVASGRYNLTFAPNNGNFTHFAILEVSGLANPAADQAAGATNGSASTVSAGPTGTLTQASEFAVAAGSSGGGGATSSWSAGWTKNVAATVDTSGTCPGAVATQQVAATTALSATLTWDTATHALMIATFKDASASTKAHPPRRGPWRIWTRR